MASFPGSKVHRVSRRRLGRGQYPSVGQATVVASASTVTVTMEFSQPVVVSGNIGIVIESSPVLSSQTQTSPTTVEQVYTTSQAGKDWSFPVDEPHVRTMQGGGVAAASGTF